MKSVAPKPRRNEAALARQYVAVAAGLNIASRGRERCRPYFECMARREAPAMRDARPAWNAAKSPRAYRQIIIYRRPKSNNASSSPNGSMASGQRRAAKMKAGGIGGGAKLAARLEAKSTAHVSHVAAAGRRRRVAAPCRPRAAQRWHEKPGGEVRGNASRQSRRQASCSNEALRGGARKYLRPGAFDARAGSSLAACRRAYNGVVGEHRRVQERLSDAGEAAPIERKR